MDNKLEKTGKKKECILTGCTERTTSTSGILDKNAYPVSTREEQGRCRWRPFDKTTSLDPTKMSVARKTKKMGRLFFMK